ncbi:MAG TPA: TonB-dependent receptor [Caulobacteraceae bacterium]|nr:TonB-dependent receptor [Caulobacteraceae bacterium]
MRHHFGLALLTSVSALAVGAAHAQTAAPAPNSSTNEVVVTGSRVITNGNNSPTPITVLTTDQLSVTKPTTVFEALLDMPLVAADKGGSTAGSTGQGGNNNSISALNIRGLGANRAVVLYDGHRVPPQNLDGTIDLNQIPQMLLQRVDIETGGSSAVYGSDAITGVVNFITDTKFNGLKMDLQGGVSGYGDDPTVKVGVAAGKGFMDGRAHIEGSVQYYNNAGLKRTDRSYIQQVGQPSISLQGNGCASATAACVPYFISRTAVDGGGTFGGEFKAANGSIYDFTQNGVATPFVAGMAVPGTASTQLGGNGGYNTQLVSMVAKQDLTQVYGRFDFDVTDHIHYYLSTFYDLEHQFTWLANVRANGSSASSALGNGFKLTSSNAFLPAADLTLIAPTANPATGLLPNNQPATFNLGKYFSTANVNPSNTNYTNNNVYVNTGFKGDFLERYNWEVSGTESHVTQSNTANETWNTARLFAALDSVNVNGTPTCWVDTQPQYAAAFPGCVPLNPFGPTSLTQAMINYVLQPTVYTGTTDMQDVSGSLSGSPINDWAGPITLAVSGEWRNLNYSLTSQGPPANVSALDCNALGILPTRTSCVQQSATNIGTTSIYPNGTAARTPVSQMVTEGAFEGEVPLLKDMPLAQSAALNFAVRYAGYESRGNVLQGTPYVTRDFDATTWKVGMDWHVNDELTVRATRSRDFRAPNLSELFLPGRTQGLSAGTDYLTGGVIGTNGYTATQAVGGNPNLQPEVGYTTTAGAVFKPIPSVSLSVDYFNIEIDNAITTVDGSALASQNACYASGGSSPYCQLQTRPGGFSRTAANMVASNNATLFYTSLPLNIAKVTSQGVDLEGNYHTILFDHPFVIRALGTYQPTVRSLQPSYPTTDAAGVSIPKIRVQVNISYNFTDQFRVDWSTRYRSTLANVDPLLGYQVAPGSETVAAASFSSVNFSYTLKKGLELYLNIQNVFNQIPPTYAPAASASPFASSAGSGGVGFYPGDDAVGRYFLIGGRAKF